MGEGFPDPDIKWKDAFKIWGEHMATMTIGVLPDECPVCGAPMVKGRHDKWEIEEGDVQHMVHSSTCPHGHGYSLDVA